MKKNYLFIALLFTLIASSQRENNVLWKAQVNPIFAGLNKTRIPHAILNDYAMEFTNIPAYNGVLNDTTYVYTSVLDDIY